ncbi:MAG: BREX-1 system adenine-specific DNA-methyltransferase PglX, partial [Spirochaetaceae bacterium]|nr:BREX-1 system adenine-specific DNA-methyltransferase PglX [Spirochaetaceae bacterium]
KELPDFKDKAILRVLEPAVGLGSFIWLLSAKYHDKVIELDVIDKNNDTIKLLKLLHSKQIMGNIVINYINDDFLLFDTKAKYDMVIGNPPFGKVEDKLLLNEYRCNNDFYNNITGNLFALFLEKSLTLSNYVAFITPKSLLSAAEFNKTRELIENNYAIKSIIDYGEDGFDGVKIETIGIVIEKVKKDNYDIKVESYITQSTHFINNKNLFDMDFNFWLIYKDDFFIQIKNTLLLAVYTCFRDRVITKRLTKDSGKIRVLKSRNIGDNKIIDIDNYDSYVDDITKLTVAKFINSGAILVPNLTYKPRACFIPKNCIADGSVAILQPINADIEVTEDDLAYYATDEFARFYAIGRNLGTRSLNIDSNSVKLWGIKKRNEHHCREFSYG